MPHKSQSDIHWLRLEISSILDACRAKTNKRFLFVIPKKVIKKAVFRNRLRRLIREAIRQDIFFADKEKVYKFKVTALPIVLNLRETTKKIQELKLPHSL